MEVKNLTLNGNVVGKYIEVNPNEYEIKLVSRKMFNNTLKTVEGFIQSTNNAIAGINGGLFELISPSKDVIGVAEDVNGNIDGSADFYGPLLYFEQNELKLDWKKINEVNGSWKISPAYYCFLLNGVERNEDIVPGYQSYYGGSDYRSMIGQKSNGTIVLACSTSPLTAHEQYTIFKNIGCTSGFNLDGGGSRQLYCNGSYVFNNSSRPLTNAIIVTNYSVPPVGDKSNICFMHLTSSAARLRADVVNGNILTTIPNGTTFEIVGLYSWNASDGYKWGWGKYNGVEGYFQYDPAVMNPVGYGLESFKMRLTGSAARLRSTIQGTILTTVPNGSTIQIDEFIDGKQSDGYQWCYGHYNGTYGYFQYDPAVMYPTND